MEELLKNEFVRAKIKGLSSRVRRAFIENLLDLYEQEAEEMIDVIEESRMELRGDFMSFEDESKSLRAESRMLEEKRKDSDNESVGRFIQSRAMSSRSSDSRLSYIDEQTNGKAIHEHMKKRGKRRPPLADVIKRSQSTESKRSQSTDRQPNKRSDSAMTTRSLPTPASLRTVEEEKDAVMNNLTSAHRQNEAERQRQAELIAQRREKRLQQKKTTEEKALELLEKAVAMDKMLLEKKEAQDQKLKERLEDIKRKRAESRIGSRDQTDGIKTDIKERPIHTETDKPGHEDSSTKSNKTEKPDKQYTLEKRDRRDKPKPDEKSKESNDKDKKAADYDFTIY